MTFKKTSDRTYPVPGQYRSYLVDRMRARDLPQVARIERTLFPEPLSLLHLARLWSTRNSCYVVVRQRRQVAGYIGFQVFGPSAHTISMGVHPDHRRKGLATMLQRTADRVAVSRGARWFTGEVRVSNGAQCKFLKEIGWQEIGICPGFFRNGEDAVVVWNWLPNP